MENEPEVTRTQMDETRASLSEKLETLEQQVVETVQGAGNAVAETVENVKDAVQDTVDTVRDTFDLRLQVRKRPWTAVGGSIVLGCLGGYLLSRSRLARVGSNGGSQPAPSDSTRSTELPDRVVQKRYAIEPEAAKQSPEQMAHALAEPGWLSGIHTQFGTEITKLKGLAIGTGLGVIRDMILRSVPEGRKPELKEIMDSITVKLGGKPVEGPVFKDGSQGGGSATGEQWQERDSSAQIGPLGEIQQHDQTTARTVA